MAQQSTAGPAAASDAGSRDLSPVSVGKQLFRESMSDDILGIAAEMAYRFLFALFPFFIFLATLSGFVAEWLDVNDPTQEVMSLVSDQLPADARAVIERQVGGVIEGGNAGLLSFGILAALWAASGAMQVVMKGTSKAYDVEETRPFWKRYLLALGLTLLATVAIVGGLVLLFGARVWAEDIADALGLGGAYSAVISWATWPLVAVILMVATAFLYWAAPNADLPFKWVTPGSVLFVLGWLLTTAGFSWYVSSFGSYQQTYGALAGVIVLMLWFYLTAAILLAGAELNAILARRVAPEQIETPEAQDAPRPIPRTTSSRPRPSIEARSTAPDVAPASPSKASLGLGALVGGIAVLGALRGLPRSRQ